MILKQEIILNAMSNNDLPFKKILLNQLECIKCGRKGDKQLVDVKSLTERNNALKINSRLVSSLKSTPENYYAIQCYYCAELNIVDRVKFENLVINNNKIGHWDDSKTIKLNEHGFITIE